MSIDNVLNIEVKETSDCIRISANIPPKLFKEIIDEMSRRRINHEFGSTWSEMVRQSLYYYIENNYGRTSSPFSENNPSIVLFIRDQLVREARQNLTVEEVRHAYKIYCDKHKYEPLKLTTLEIMKYVQDTLGIRVSSSVKRYEIDETGKMRPTYHQGFSCVAFK